MKLLFPRGMDTLPLSKENLMDQLKFKVRKEMYFHAK